MRPATYTLETCACCGCPCEWPVDPRMVSPRCDRCRAECRRLYPNMQNTDCGRHNPNFRGTSSHAYELDRSPQRNGVSQLTPATENGKGFSL